MNAAVALRQHYDDVRKRLHVSRKPYAVVKMEAIKPEPEPEPIPEPIPEPAAQVIELKSSNPFLEVDESVKAALRWPPKERITEILKDTGYTVTDIKGRSRVQKLVRLRQHICWVLHKEFKWSYPRIGKYIQKDHTTVLHGVLKWQEILDSKEKTNDNACND